MSQKLSWGRFTNFLLVFAAISLCMRTSVLLFAFISKHFPESLSFLNNVFLEHSDILLSEEQQRRREKTEHPETTGPQRPLQGTRRGRIPFFPRARAAFSSVDHMLGRKASISAFERRETKHSVLWSYRHGVSCQLQKKI